MRGRPGRMEMKGKEMPCPETSDRNRESEDGGSSPFIS